MYYFAYGSNMDSDRMKERHVDFKSREHAELKDYRLKFNKISDKNETEGYANVEPDNGSMVEGVLYEVESLDELDKYEGYPNHYTKCEKEVLLDNLKKVKAVLYIANPDKIDNTRKPSEEYLDHLLKGKEFLSPEYYDFLKKFIE